MLVDNKWMEETMNREITETTCKEDAREGKQRGTKIQTVLFKNHEWQLTKLGQLPFMLFTRIA